ncbi:hypothetical protein LOTGIDRAFT_195608 [Lottia gigantea]|uniref:Small integral membrane protein 14 n=1 Tax=Lottia gigantea TaxID=225164 RepID=V3ZTR2_LOTGI|nr:hypothetical protein LOTGIDRAFT_195608 [Lottia gigantea]ESO85930.1 hypothetical protein LOTGIDRAFT_195608 [Lottia gigantea]
MSDFDPCECIWNHETAMQRLMNMLRNSQNVCTDTQCIESLPGETTMPNGGYNMIAMMMIGWLVVATALFLFRPSSLRNRGDGKPSRPSDSNPPPPPPPAPPAH